VIRLNPAGDVGSLIQSDGGKRDASMGKSRKSTRMNMDQLIAIYSSSVKTTIARLMNPISIPRTKPVEDIAPRLHLHLRNPSSTINDKIDD
jgi:hypothetical protein